MWVYAGNRDGMPRWVERILEMYEMYAQRWQANTEMKHDFGHPSEVVSQVVVGNQQKWHTLRPERS